MSDERDKNLPARQAPPAQIQHRDTYIASPIAHRSLLGRVASAFVSRLNARMLHDNTEEVSARIAYAREHGELADAMLEAERKVAHYINHRDDIIEDDHAAHLDGMEENEHGRELNRRRRQGTIAALDAQAGCAATEAGYDMKIMIATKEAALAEAQAKAERAKWGRDAFGQSLPFRKERLEHLYKTGALDAEVNRLIHEAGRDEQSRENARGAGTSSSDLAGANAKINELLAELDQELDIAHATQASPDHLAALYGLKARLSAKLSI